MYAGTTPALAVFTAATTLLTAAAFAVPGALGRRSIASRVAIASVVWNSIVIFPTYVLGYTNTLYAGYLGASVASLASLVLFIAWRRVGGIRALGIEILASARAFVVAPFAAFRVATRAGSFVSFCVLTAMLGMAWLTAQAVLLGTWGDWDCLWYHEPMIGFAIQHHGFAAVPLDMGLQKINGSARLSEMTMLYFGIFHGRWAIDLVNPLFMPLYAASTYLVARELGLARVYAVGWVTVALTLPGIVRLLPTTMVDPHAAALLMGAAYFCTKRELSLVDGVLGALALTLAMGAKTVNVPPGLLLCLVLLVRLVRRRKHLSTLGLVATILVGATLCLGIIACTHLTNFVRFHNPLWPDIRIDLPEYGIHWPGYYTLGDTNVPPADAVSRDIDVQVRRAVAIPHSNNDGHSWQLIDYGFGVLWLLVPLAALCVIGLVFGTIRAFVRPADPVLRARYAMLSQLVFVAIVGMYALRVPFHIGRYFLGVLPISFCLVGFMCTRVRMARAQEGLIALVVFSAVATVVWNPRNWIRSPKVLWTAAHTPAPQRFLAQDAGSAVDAHVGLVRERELGPGDLVVFERIAYVALLWNEHYSNRVEWLEDDPDPLPAANRRHATMLYAGSGGWLDQRARLPESEWERVGLLQLDGAGALYRRKRFRRAARPSPPHSPPPPPARAPR